MLRHTIFEGDYHSCLDVEVVKVDPSTGAIENDADRNTETRVWFETGPSGYQDLSLNCGGKTYEEATIKLANRVMESYEQAETYLENEILREHYVEICEVICALETDDIEEIFPYPDNLKLHSSLTLFLDIDPDMDAPEEVLDRFFYGKKDKKTLAVLEEWMGF